jgi:ring-1,2-phenylacetyl-CoA epoxidase subunit PaaE
VLESLIENGAQPPYSCMDGACMACLAKIQEGRVYQEDPGILSDDNVANCESLTCQAKPLSRIVKISYDNI